MSDTLMRQWQMLRMIPRHPSKISTTEIMNSLNQEGFETTARTIQRDLIKLADIYPLEIDQRDKPFGWSWSAEARLMDVPGMDSHMALAFWLAKEHLEPLLPRSTARQLQFHFKEAAKVLDSIQANKGAPSWRNKVRVLHRGPKLQSPPIDPKVQNQVYDALLQSRCVAITYSPRGQNQIKEYEINPLGLVLKDGVFYLVCTMWDYQDIRLITLHRISKAEKLEKPATRPADFDLDTYIASGELDFSIGGEIHLEARLSSSPAYHLTERPISNDQTITEQDDGEFLITATVVDTGELRWWLLGFGDQVEVLKPLALRREMKEIALSMAEQYSD